MVDISVDDNADIGVDAAIKACLDLQHPRSFFLFAGAGSGKTRSLVEALKHVRNNVGKELKSYDRRVGVITFTNAACDEIKRRLEFDPLIEVSTIHSFAWTLIGGFNRDIREWLRTNLALEISELETEEAKGRKGTKASAQRLAKIASKTRRRLRLDEIRTFTYSPTGDNSGRDALNHSEVIKITASFLREKATLRKILVNRYPILLIDESQDTNGQLISSFFDVQAENATTFCLGMFGDTMQRIYTDGKVDLGKNLPDDWEKPVKRLNYRCPRRVIALINKIRSAVDPQIQIPSSRNVEGLVRLFILPSDTADKPAAEQIAAERMAELTRDHAWTAGDGRKTLTLEHRMAARRMGFEDMFVPLHAVADFRSGLLDGTLAAVRLFANEVFPLIRAEQSGDKFAVARILRKLSPLMSVQALREAGDQPAQLRKVREALERLASLWANKASPTFREVLMSLSKTGLLAVPPSLLIAVSSNAVAGDAEPSDEEADQLTEKAAAIDAFLEAPFSQIEAYSLYVSGNGPFDTHQGVKGLEFPRVMVIMDDDDARGFTFNYDELFGGKDAGNSRVESTRRLFYVTCSRAEKSLALIAYTAHPKKVHSYVTQNGWFEEGEIQVGL